jgi:hypothetical protein
MASPISNDFFVSGALPFDSKLKFDSISDFDAYPLALKWDGMPVSLPFQSAGPDAGLWVYDMDNDILVRPTGGGGAATVLNGNQILVSSTNGTDVRVGLNKYDVAAPFQTLAAANAEAVAGDRIVVLAGTYGIAAPMLAVDNVIYHFERGTAITYNTGLGNSFLFDLTNVTNQLVVTGHATIEFTYTGGGNSGIMGNVNPNVNLIEFNAESILFQGNSTITFVSANFVRWNVPQLIDTGSGASLLFTARTHAEITMLERCDALITFTDDALTDNRQVANINLGAYNTLQCPSALGFMTHNITALRGQFSSAGSAIYNYTADTIDDFTSVAQGGRFYGKCRLFLQNGSSPTFNVNSIVHYEADIVEHVGFVGDYLIQLTNSEAKAFYLKARTILAPKLLNCPASVVSGNVSIEFDECFVANINDAVSVADTSIVRISGNYMEIDAATSVSPLTNAFAISGGKVTYDVLNTVITGTSSNQVWFAQFFNGGENHFFETNLLASAGANNNGYLLGGYTGILNIGRSRLTLPLAGLAISGTGQTVQAAAVGNRPVGGVTIDGFYNVKFDINALTNVAPELSDSVALHSVALGGNARASVESILGKLSANYKKRIIDFNDYLTLNGLVSGLDIGTATGTGSGWAISPNIATNGIGVVRGSTGTTATGRVYMGNNNNALFRFSNDQFAVEWRIFLPLLSTAVERFQFSCGFQENTGGINHLDGAYFLYDEGGVAAGSTATPNWKLVTANNGVRTFEITTTAVAAGAWTTLRIQGNSSAITFSVNGFSFLPITTNIPSTAGRETSYGMTLQKSIGTTTRQVDIDYRLIDFAYIISR